ncbi:MAG: flagellar basal body L-ring protein FlgH [Planctomycetota bacterium]
MNRDSKPNSFTFLGQVVRSALLPLACLVGSPLFAQTSSLLQQGTPVVQQNSGVIPGFPMTPARTFDANGGVPARMQLAPTPTLAAPPIVGPVMPGPTTAGPMTAGPMTAGLPQVQPVYLQSASWTHQPPPPVRVFRKNDIITIRVDELSRVLAEGEAETRKQTLFQTVLSDWIRIQNFRLRPDPQEDGDPTVAAQSNNQYRAESGVETRESITFNIAAKIVDIRPNGTLLLEARKAIRVNDNLWETSLAGSCRAADVAPDNVVLSRDLIDLEIRKDDRGHLREGYQRGWLQRAIDRFSPF